MSRKVRGLCAAILGVAVVWGVSGCHAAPGEQRPAPVLSGEDLQGQPVDIADLEGDVVVVNAWASWCGPCRDEMPVLAAAHEELGDDGLRIVGLNVRDDPESARRLEDQSGVRFPSVVDPDGDLAVEWGVRGMPQTFVVGPEGLIVDHRYGAVDEEWVSTVVEPLVTEGRAGTDVAETAPPHEGRP